MTRALILLAPALLAACATTPRAGPTEVSRFHNNAPAPGGTIAVRPMPDTGTTPSPEFDLYAGAVSSELARLGFRPGDGGELVAEVAFRRVPRGQVRTPPRFSIGLGGGSFGGGRGGGVGLGGGIGTGIGGRTYDVTGTELFVRIKRRDGTVTWEGRASRDDLAGQTPDTARRLAVALFRDYPGESGITNTIP